MVPYFPGTAVADLPPLPSSDWNLSLDQILKNLIDADNPQPEHGKLRTWISQLTAALTSAIRVINAEADRLDPADPDGTHARSAADQAASALRVGPGDGYKTAIAYAMTLASHTRTLAEHERALAVDLGELTPAHEPTADGEGDPGVRGQE